MIFLNLQSNTTYMKTARYQIDNTFNLIIADINTTLNNSNSSLGPYKRNNNYFKSLVGKYKNTNIDNGLNSLVELNRVLSV